MFFPVFLYIPKRYGQSRVDACPFCGKQAVAENDQGIPVCAAHKNDTLPELKCSCGDWLDLRNGKFSPFFSCMKCGNISLRKALEINSENISSNNRSNHRNNNDNNKEGSNKYGESKDSDTNENSKSSTKHKPREIIVRSDELDFL